MLILLKVLNRDSVLYTESLLCIGAGMSSVRLVEWSSVGWCEQKYLPSEKSKGSLFKRGADGGILM